MPDPAPSSRTAEERARGVYGVCVDCGAVAWELLRGVSDCCMDCDPSAYRDDWGDDPCASCDCLTDDECEAL